MVFLGIHTISFGDLDAASRPEERAEYLRKWKERNPEKVKSYQRKRDRNKWAKRKHDEVTYFVRCNDFVKIGTTTNILDRMKTLQIGCPYELELMGTCSLDESIIHEKFKHLHHRGEWHILSAKLLSFIEEMVE